MSLFLQSLRALPRMGVRPLVGLLLSKQNKHGFCFLRCFVSRDLHYVIMSKTLAVSL